jgi:hypothetical protein
MEEQQSTVMTDALSQEGSGGFPVVRPNTASFAVQNKRGVKTLTVDKTVVVSLP